MRVDVVSIFPDYLSPLGLSLPGKAQRTGLLDLRVHDLRRWTHDRHRTVDDTPYGGGAGMVMRPEPWGEALDELVETATGRPVLVVPTPAGTPFTQAIAAELAAEDHLVVACGRYEGIDQRVVDHAATRMRVLEVSVGDYVLNGGEAAALVVLEAVVRLLPGFMGNADSLTEESHAGGLLEYPVFTKPPSWRGLVVPEVLLSGDHAGVAAWRHEQALRRTAERRPDLLHASRLVTVGGLTDAEWRLATPSDAGELLTLQRACWVQEGMANDSWGVPALNETLEQVRADLEAWTTWVLRAHGRLVGSVRARLQGGRDDREWFIGRLMVAPDLQGHGLGRWLLERAEEAAPADARSWGLVTGARSEDNLRRYRRAGYRAAAEQPEPWIVHLRKRRR
ncbi:MAG: tRNA (guanine37-N1)-methyltransferase [Nocardioidaceae bacterium]|nr:tRNA (guanine37-N1)-methyltransferase [Nocardioidaceae bacterium]